MIHYLFFYHHEPWDSKTISTKPYREADKNVAIYVEMMKSNQVLTNGAVILAIWDAVALMTE